MGKYRRHAFRDYELGTLKGRPVAVWRENGRRRRFRLGDPSTTQLAAELELEKFVRAREARDTIRLVTVGEIYNAFLKERANSGRSTNKHAVSWKALERHFGHLRPDDIDQRLCEDFDKARSSQGRKPGTIWTDLSCLRAALRWGAKTKRTDPVPHIWLPRQPPPRDRHLSKAEAERLIAGAVQPHVRLFMILAVATAARHRAILGLTWQRVDFERGLIDLRDPSSPVTNKRRSVVPMNAMLRAALMEARPAALSPYVIEWNGVPIRSIRKGFAEAAKRAGLDDVSPHVLRHSAAVLMVSAGAPIEMVSEYLGHTSPRLTWSIYGRYRPDAMKQAADALNLDLRRLAR
jgi:integrase